MDIHAIDTVSTTQRPFDSTTLHNFSIREPGSAITHGIAMVFALIGAIPLMRRAVTGGTVTWIAAFIFCASMILLYGASTAFHTFDINPRVNTILKKADHMMISVFIAGSYTPIYKIEETHFGQNTKNALMRIPASASPHTTASSVSPVVSGRTRRQIGV